MMRCRAGTTSVEFAIVAVVFLTMVGGTIEFGRYVWTRTAVQYAVEKAARCASVNTTTCGNTSAVQTYAFNVMLAAGVAASDFSYISNATCGSVSGKQVSVNKTYTFLFAGLLPAPPPLVASSCWPT